MCPAHSKIYQIINIFTMMFVYHYVIIPFHPQYLPKHAPLILQSGGIQSRGVDCLRTPKFTLLLTARESTCIELIVRNKNQCPTLKACAKKSCSKNA